MNGRVLVAGIGNIFLSDDGFGSEAARQLAVTPLPTWVDVIDYGIRGMHLAYDLLDGYEALIILDAAPRGGKPGDVVVIEVGPDDLGQGPLDAHGMEPTAVLASLASLGGRLPRTFVIGCEPSDVSEGMGLSPPVAAAAARTGAIVTALLRAELRMLVPDNQPLSTSSTSQEGSG
jgi:hydrogenase maturation protease